MSGANPRTIEAAVPLLLVSLPIDDPIAGDQMSASPTNQIERSRGTADRQKPVCARADDEREALLKLSLYAAKSGRPLRSQWTASRLRKVRRLARGEHELLPRKSHRRQLCATVPIITGTAKASAARSVTDDLVSSVTTSAAPPSAQGNAPIASRSVGMRTADGCAGLKRPDGWDALHPAIERTRSNPEGRNHLCAPPPRAYRPSDIVYCFALGGAT
jgi:hypothetical protein